ncbi:hypothetical protein SGFS_016830 [Streptomyces graminofaciens]|uniref:Uncharacterized protein n=1 Tax=Streptomyces graminofaciens TaxID=68212 RepID=A0ABM7F3J5_9ACTN|nr:hypothetical protein SGFS_016830 [Streptomyces graminofaciens]
MWRGRWVGGARRGSRRIAECAECRGQRPEGFRPRRPNPSHHEQAAPPDPQAGLSSVGASWSRAKFPAPFRGAGNFARGVWGRSPDRARAPPLSRAAAPPPGR